MRELEVRPERPGEASRVYAVQRAAFGRREEALLVDALRERARPQISLVARFGDEIVGHVFFSPVRIEGEGAAPPVAGLAPLAVEPARQGQGVGSALVRAGLERAPDLGWRAVFLLGDPRYYARFGFELAAPRGFQYESGGFERAFQVCELAPGSLAGCAGRVYYDDAFAGL